MQFAPLRYLRQRNGSGSMLVGLLIVVGLALIIFGVQLYLKKTAKDPDVSLDLMPWKEWRLREASEKTQPPPSKNQADITEGIEFRASAEAKGTENTPRGDVTLKVQPDGIVIGLWSGNYYNDAKVNFDGGGNFKGYVCPLKIYSGEEGKDRSKLYFITKGKFTLHETDLKNKYHIRIGDLYVTGWIDPKYTAFGKVTITSDEKYFEAFDWQAYRPVKTKP
jgi:hypothetical protein